MTKSFDCRFRVYYEDTDASGVMYHARYLVFFERARTEFLRSLGYSQQQLMQEQAVAFTLSDLNIRYRQAARLDDELIVSTQVEKASYASVIFKQQMFRASDPETLLSEARVRAGCVSYPEFQVTRMPEPIRAALFQ